MNGINVKYPQGLRKFCLRMHFHSSSAYREMRQFFSNRLPTIRTMRRWLMCIDASPGITEPALEAISEKVAMYRDQGKKLQICLLSDEISIRKNVLWNETKKSFEGFSEATSQNQKKSDKVPLIKDALVFMAVGDDFRITVAYQFLCGMSAVDRALFTEEVIRHVDLTGAKIISLTSDGLAANVAVARQLGANFKQNKTYIPRPGHPNEKIYIIFDPPHMIKLLRQYLAENNLWYENEELKWEYLKLLSDRQDTENFSMTNKLSKGTVVTILTNSLLVIPKITQILTLFLKK